MLGPAAERAAIDRPLGRARVRRGGVLVLRGEPGIGKTTLCSYDAQWLDRPSSEALSVAIRTLDDRGVAMLIAVRDGDGRPFESDATADLRVEGLDEPAAIA